MDMFKLLPALCFIINSTAVKNSNWNDYCYTNIIKLSIEGYVKFEWQGRFRVQICLFIFLHTKLAFSLQ